ncbi:MAG: cbb3-type cytochrome oxidase assembly protein CcoS [Arenicella sp.]
MIILYLLIPLSIVFVIVTLYAFFWAVTANQFGDLDSPAWRILEDDTPVNPMRTTATDVDALSNNKQLDGKPLNQQLEITENS